MVGVDGDGQAVAAATELLADVPNAHVHGGRADASGLPAASFNMVVLRHVLAHNGSAEARILEHLAGLLRPAGTRFSPTSTRWASRSAPRCPRWTS